MCASQLDKFVEGLLERPQHRRAVYGMLVGKAGPHGSLQPLYGRNAASLFTPASNTKLFSAASLFLHTDAVTFRYATQFLSSPTSPAEASRLCIKGSGDPSITHADIRSAAAQCGSPHD